MGFHSSAITFNNSEWDRGFINNIISNKTKTYIHQFNYVPKYIKHFMHGESEDTTLLLGAEIEVGGNNNISSDNDKNSTVKKCIQIMNRSDSDEEKKRSIISKIEDRIWKRRTARWFSFSSVGGLNTRWGRFLQRIPEIFCRAADLC